MSYRTILKIKLKTIRIRFNEVSIKYSLNGYKSENLTTLNKHIQSVYILTFRYFRYSLIWLTILVTSSCACETLPKDLPRFLPDQKAFSTIDILNAGAWIRIDNRKIPKSIMSALPKDIQEYFNEPDIKKDSPLEFTLVDLDRDGVDEMIVVHPWLLGSGGRNFIIMRQERGGRWKAIGHIAGGPTFQFDQKKRAYYRATSYWRFGADVVQNVFVYSAGKFRQTNQTELPRTLTDTCHWYAQWQQLNLYGYVGSEEKSVLWKCSSQGCELKYGIRTPTSPIQDRSGSAC